MYKDFMALTKPVHEVFVVVEQRGILPPLIPMRGNRGYKFDNNALCEYHKQKGPTKRCYQLKNAIEDVI